MHEALPDEMLDSLLSLLRPPFFVGTQQQNSRLFILFYFFISAEHVAINVMEFSLKPFEIFSYKKKIDLLVEKTFLNNVR